MSKVKIQGFNPKEQKLYDTFSDGEYHTITELKDKFLHLAGDNDTKAQSMVRNSVRRLIRDGWITSIAPGTYQLTEDGASWVKEKIDITTSFGVKPGRPTGSSGNSVNKKTTKKTKKKATKKKKTTKKTKFVAKNKKKMQSKKSSPPVHVVTRARKEFAQMTAYDKAVEAAKELMEDGNL